MSSILNSLARTCAAIAITAAFSSAAPAAMPPLTAPLAPPALQNAITGDNTPNDAFFGKGNKGDKDNREAQRRAEQKRKAADAKRREDQRRKAEDAKRREDQRRKAEDAKRREDQRRKAADAKRRDEQKRKAADAKRRDEQKRKAADAKRRDEQKRKAADAKRREDQRRKAADANRRDEQKRKAAADARRREELKRQADDDARRRQGLQRQSQQRQAQQRQSQQRQAEDANRRKAEQQKGIDAARRSDELRRRAEDARRAQQARQKAQDSSRRLAESKRLIDARRRADADRRQDLATRRQSGERSSRPLGAPSGRPGADTSKSPSRGIRSGNQDSRQSGDSMFTSPPRTGRNAFSDRAGTREARSPGSRPSLDSSSRPTFDAIKKRSFGSGVNGLTDSGDGPLRGPENLPPVKRHPGSVPVDQSHNAARGRFTDANGGPTGDGGGPTGDGGGPANDGGGLFNDGGGPGGGGGGPANDGGGPAGRKHSVRSGVWSSDHDNPWIPDNDDDEVENDHHGNNHNENNHHENNHHENNHYEYNYEYEYNYHYNYWNNYFDPWDRCNWWSHPHRWSRGSWCDDWWWSGYYCDDSPHWSFSFSVWIGDGFSFRHRPWRNYYRHSWRHYRHWRHPRLHRPWWRRHDYYYYDAYDWDWPYIQVSYAPVQYVSYDYPTTEYVEVVDLPAPVAPSLDEGWERLRQGQPSAAQDLFAELVYALPSAGESRIGYAIATGLLHRDEASISAMRRALRDQPEAVLSVPDDPLLHEQLRVLLDHFAQRVRYDAADADGLFMVAALQFILDEHATAYFAIDAAIRNGDADDSAYNLRIMLEDVMYRQF